MEDMEEQYALMVEDLELPEEELDEMLGASVSALFALSLPYLREPSPEPVFCSRILPVVRAAYQRHRTECELLGVGRGVWPHSSTPAHAHWQQRHASARWHAQHFP